MRHYNIFIITLFISTNVISQTMTEILDKTHKDSTKVVCRDCYQGEPSYYFDGKKIDINKLFITLGNIKGIEIFTLKSAIAIFGDTAKAGVISITSKRRLKLLTLNKLLFKNGIDSNQIDKFEIEINDKQVQDTTILIDSKAKVFPIYKKNVGESTLERNRIICGALIYTTLNIDKK